MSTSDEQTSAQAKQAVTDAEATDADATDAEATVTDAEAPDAETDAETDATDATEADDAAVPAAAVPVRRRTSWLRRNLIPAVAAGLVLVSAVAAASVYWWLYRPDRLTDSAAQRQVVAAAKEGTEALLSYSPENLDADLANAKSHLTGEFLSYYNDFTDKVVAPASRQKGVKTEANVARAAVSQIEPGRAAVLVFVNQVTTSKERPTPALSTSSVVVTLVNSGGRWLISGFNPV
jgi:Mce-associated membrane protein